MKNIKLFILILFVSFKKLYSQDSTKLYFQNNKIQFSILAFRSFNSFPGSTYFYSISNNYEHVFKNKFSIGLNFNHSNDQFNRDYYLGPRFNLYLIKNKKKELYIGTGLGVAKRMFWTKKTEKNIQIKFQIGYRFKIRRSLNGLVEWSNYRYGGSFPTIGICYNFNSF